MNMMSLKAAAERAAPLALGLLLLAVSAAWATTEKEYEDATLLLIDHKAGAIGVVLHGDKPGEDRKCSFVTDPAAVYITDPAGREVDFEQLQPGHSISFVTETGPAGQETITEITDYGMSV